MSNAEMAEISSPVSPHLCPAIPGMKVDQPGIIKKFSLTHLASRESSDWSFGWAGASGWASRWPLARSPLAASRSSTGLVLFRMSAAVPDPFAAKILDYLFLGSREHAKDAEFLEKNDIYHILNVTPTRNVDPVAGVPNFFEKDSRYTYVRLLFICPARGFCSLWC